MLSVSAVGHHPRKKNHTLPVVESNIQRAGPFIFYYKGSSWCIPESFEFPQNTTRLAGWRKLAEGFGAC